MNDHAMPGTMSQADDWDRGAVFAVARVVALAFVLVLAANTLQAKAQFLPDIPNQNRWQLVDNMSDEFEGASLDATKWHVQGAPNFGQSAYYYSNFTGRDTWRYETQNARVEDGLLRITSRFDPDPSDPNQPNALWSTAGVVANHTFQYGYMEVRARTADAAVASSFWTTGRTGTGSCYDAPNTCSEIDVFEIFGSPLPAPRDTQRDRRYWSSVHDWSQPGGPSTWTDTDTYLDFNPALDFHTYGVDWDENSITFYVDGEVLRTVTRAQVESEGLNGGRWAAIDPSRIWVDSEIFEWMLEPPANASFSVDYDIDYIRVWQRDRLEADFNGDGVVGLLDLDILGANYRLTDATYAQGDANGDNLVTLLDLDVLGTQWGDTNVSFAAALQASAIPEPACLSMLAMGMVGIGQRRRR